MEPRQHASQHTNWQSESTGHRFYNKTQPFSLLSKKRSAMPPAVSNPLNAYKLRKDKERQRVLDRYEIVGYIAAGTYGRVYKAKSKVL